jgi:GNAT superfamily N-acetyltransferase
MSPQPMEVPIVSVDDVVACARSVRTRLAVESIIAGNTGGRLWRVERDGVTSLELLWDQGNNVLFVGRGSGDRPGADDHARLLSDFLATTFKREALAARAPFFAVAAVGGAPGELVEQATASFSPHPVTKRFCALRREPAAGRAPESLAVVPIDDALLAGRTASGTEPVREEVAWMWPSLGRFIERGFGVAGVLDGAVVAWCTAEYVGPASCGIGIETVEPHRRKGIAFAAAREFLAESRRRGLRPYWECDEANRPSVALAEKLGFDAVETVTATYCRFA